MDGYHEVGGFTHPVRIRRTFCLRSSILRRTGPSGSVRVLSPGTDGSVAGSMVWYSNITQFYKRSVFISSPIKTLIVL